MPDCDALGQAVSDAQAAVNTCQASINNCQDAIGTYTEALNNKSMELSQAQAAQAALDPLSLTYLDDYAALDATIHQLQLDCGALSAQIGTAQAQMADFQSDMTGLQATLQTANDAYAANCI